MDETSPAPDDNPYEPPRSALSVADEKLERRSLRWHHWLAFFSPAMIGGSFAAMGTASLSRVGTGVILGTLLCVMNGVWLARFNTHGNRGLNGCFWMFWGLIANAALAFCGCALVLL